MKPLVLVLKRNFFLIGFFFISTFIIATSIKLVPIVTGTKKGNDEKVAESKTERKKGSNKIIARQQRTISFTDAPSLTTDKPDYAPGTTATLTGSGFLPHESVRLQVLHANYHEGDPIGDDHEPWYVAADENGNFVTTWHVCEDDCVGELLRATADGQDPDPTIAPRHAEVYFTDSPQIVTVEVDGQDPDPVTAGNCATFTVTITRQNSNDDFDAELSASLPAGVTGTFTTIPGGLTVTGNMVTIPGSSNSGNTSYVVGLQLCIDACDDYAATETFSVTAIKRPGQSQEAKDQETGFGNLNIVNDEDPPVITPSGDDLSLGCNPLASDIEGALGTATATDACATLTITAFDGEVVTNSCGRSQTRTFTAIDGAGNTSAAFRTATWTEDNTPPTFVGSYVAIPLGCNPASSDIEAALGSANATDGCSTPTITSHDGDPTGTCTRSVTRTFTATDGCGKIATTSRTVTWREDATPPVFTGTYTDIILGCNPASSEITAALGTACATDACGTPTITFNDATTGTCIKSATRTFTARDGCGNTATKSRTVIYRVDGVAPGFTGTYNDVILGCNPAPGDITAALGTACATDACGTPTITYSDATTGTCIKSATRTFTATDGCGNTATKSRTVTYKDDTTPPAFTGSYANITLSGCNPAASDITAALGTACATDACGMPTVTSPADVTTGTCLITITKRWTARDACGNTSTASRSVTYKNDQTGPVLTGLSQTCLWPPNHKMVDIVIKATDGCGALSSGYVTVTSNEPKNDIGDGNTDADMAWLGGVEQSGTPYTVKGQVLPGSDGQLHIQLRAERSGVFALVTPDFGRVYTLNYSVTDGCGNSATSTATVMVGHNIVNPKPGCAYPINTVVNFSGTFWDVPGNKHTAKWLVDGVSTTGTVTSEPSGNKLGKATGSFKPTVAGVYKLQMNITDQKGVTGYATTSGDYEAYFVAYDPKGGFTYGSGQFTSPAGALTARPNLSSPVTFGFASNYYKSATNPKGETELDFKLTDGNYSFAFNALNYDYLVVNGSKAQYKGLGKTIINGVEQSGYAFIMTVIDGKTPTNPAGVDLIRLKIYNKNTGAVIYDNQTGASETADPTTAVDDPNEDGSDIVVTGGAPTSMNGDLTRAAQMEIVPEVSELKVKVYPNPTEHEFTLYLDGASNEKVLLTVYDAIGRQVKKIEKGDATGALRFGENLKVGVYIVEVRQGAKRKIIKVTKQ